MDWKIRQKYKISSIEKIVQRWLKWNYRFTRSWLSGNYRRIKNIWNLEHRTRMFWKFWIYWYIRLKLIGGLRWWWKWFYWVWVWGWILNYYEYFIFIFNFILIWLIFCFFIIFILYNNHNLFNFKILSSFFFN